MRIDCILPHRAPDDFPREVRQALVPTAVAERQVLVIHPQQMRDGRVGVGHGDRVLHRMTAADMTALEARVKPVAGDGRFEPHKSTQNYDGPYHREQHGFAV